MKVYAVLEGERWEGYSIVSLHATRLGAERAADQKNPKWREEDENSCFYTTVEEYDVEEEAE